MALIVRLAPTRVPSHVIKERINWSKHCYKGYLKWSGGRQRSGACAYLLFQILGIFADLHQKSRHGYPPLTINKYIIVGAIPSKT